MMDDLLTALHDAGVEALDLDPAHNRLRCLPMTPQALTSQIIQHKADLLALARGRRCTMPIAALLADLHAPPLHPYTGRCALPGGYRGPSGDVNHYDARRLIARLYVLKGQPNLANDILRGDWSRYRALYGAEGTRHAE